MKADILIEPEPTVIESETPPQLTEIINTDRLQFDSSLSDDRRVRSVVYNKLVAAANRLPDHLSLVVFEAYRPMKRQIALWDKVWADIKQTYPNDDDATLALRCNRFVANPYKHGSGHQYGCAVDITIVDNMTGMPLDMGCGLQEFNDKTATECSGLTEQQCYNRRLLVSVLAHEGMVNYPPEWWHYSYGDRQWAIQMNRDETLYGVLPF